MPTLDRNTGGIVDGFDEVMQSLTTILTTRRGTRVERREFGSEVPRIVDRGLSPGNLIDYYAAIADEVRQEPRFRITRMGLAADADPVAGHAIFEVEGLYYPRGHLGDYSVVETARGRVSVSDTSRRL